MPFVPFSSLARRFVVSVLVRVLFPSGTDTLSFSGFTLSMIVVSTFSDGNVKAVYPPPDVPMTLTLYISFDSIWLE